MVKRARTTSYRKPSTSSTTTPYSRPSQAATAKRLAMTPELKAYDQFDESLEAFPRLINTVTIGGDTNQRIGRSIRINKIELRVSMETLTGTEASICRFVCFQDKMPNGAFPTLGDVFNSQATGTTLQTLLPKNIYNLNRFNILIDRTYDMSQHEDATGIGAIQKLIVIPNKNIKTVFSDIVAGIPPTINDMSANTLYVMALITIPSLMEVKVHSRIHYYDQ